MLNSIRWTLQLWHAALMAAVMVGFGTATYLGVSRSRYAQVDAELQRDVQTLAAGVRLPPREGNFGGPQRGRGNWQPGDAAFNGGGPGGPGGPRDQGGGMGGGTGGFGGGPAGQGGNHFPESPEVDVPVALAGRSASGDSANPDGLYYVVWNVNGAVIKSSLGPSDVMPAAPPPAPNPPRPEPPVARERDGVREAYVYGAMATRALVGRSIAREETELKHLRYMIAGVGLGVLMVGLVGGWLLSLRAVRPIRLIVSAARDISATNLSKRIDVAATQSELGSLAVVLNEMFARLETAFAQQTRFTADASHELRTPLAVIHTHAQLALARERTSEEYQKALATCLRASGRMKGLIDSLLLLASADAGRLRLEKQTVNLRDVVQECLGLITPLAEERKISLESNLRNAEVTGDATRLSQVVINFLSNAIRYNKENGRVMVSVGVEGAECVITVADTGVGIGQEHLPNLFTRFYRVDAARNRDAGGSGLGLSICKSIVEAHGGRIDLDSTEGVGTTVRVILPGAETAGIVVGQVQVGRDKTPVLGVGTSGNGL